MKTFKIHIDSSLNRLGIDFSPPLHTWKFHHISPNQFCYFIINNIWSKYQYESLTVETFKKVEYDLNNLVCDWIGKGYISLP